MIIYVSTTNDGVTLQQQYQKYRSQVHAARTKIRMGFGAAMFLSGVDLLVAVKILTDAPPEIKQLGFFVLIDGAIFFLLGVGIVGAKRSAAMSLTTYFTISKFIQAGMGTLPPLVLLLSVVFILIFCAATIGTIDYHQLQQQEHFFKAYLTGYESLKVEQVAREDSEQRHIPAPTSPAITTESKTPQSLASSAKSDRLIPCQELVDLCGGDKHQAMWLLSQIRMKHPDRDANWCNAEAIDHMNE